LYQDFIILYFPKWFSFFHNWQNKLSKSLFYLWKIYWLAYPSLQVLQYIYILLFYCINLCLTDLMKPISPKRKTNSEGNLKSIHQVLIGLQFYAIGTSQTVAGNYSQAFVSRACVSHALCNMFHIFPNRSYSRKFYQSRNSLHFRVGQNTIRWWISKPWKESGYHPEVGYLTRQVRILYKRHVSLTSEN